jgi:serine/threonine-protein kinase HipA
MFRAFADTAPDRWGRALITRSEKRRATANNVTPRSLGEIDFLLGVRDDLREGAIRFRSPTTGAFLASEEKGVPQLAGLPELLDAAERLEAGDETPVDLSELIRVGSSLGGARPKAHVLDGEGRVAIAKFPSARHDTWNVMAWEKVASDLATAARINVSKSRLLRIAGRSVLVIVRFDRHGDRRIGYVSAMTMLEATDQNVGSYIDLAGVIERVSPTASDDLRELWRRIAFSILISNTDDHLRNHGFLHDQGGSWRLSPAFDLNPNPEPGPKHLSNTIDGYETEANIQTLLSVADYFRLAKEEATEVLGEVLGATMRWREIAAEHDLPQDEIEEMGTAFEHTETWAARDIVGG